MQAADIENLTREHLPRIYRAALVLTGNPWDADDLAQETFLILSREFEQFQGRSSIYSWLYGILLNLERRERRRIGLRRQKLRVLWGQEELEPRSTPAAEAPIEAAEWKRSLWGFVARLPDGQRQALVLRFSEHLHYEEIAEAMNCPLGTVKSRIFNGLSTLRELMQAEASDLQQIPLFPHDDTRPLTADKATG
jgi:RNA polymerase sigma-70 factor (ECF subfamily)